MFDNSKKSPRLILLGFLFVLIGTNLVNYFLFGFEPSSPPGAASLDPAQGQFEGLPDELALFREVLDLVSRHHLEPVEMEELVEGAIRGMLKVLGDPQTVFYDPQELENFWVQTMGSFGGVGVRIVEVDEQVVIFETLPGTPAEKAGLYPGDRIRSADGEDLTGRGLDRAVQLLRGPKGTTVTITVERPGAAEPITVTLERDEIKVRTVTSKMLQPGLGYIKITNFDSHTGAEFVRQLHELEAAGLNKGLILDLRGNSGGLVHEAITVAKQLVPEGEIARLVDRHEQIRDIHYSSARPKPYPLVVLVNEETASAAEIVAGALQDRGAALLVGATTYGKATVQEIEQLSGGNALRLTVARYRTPSGRDIHGAGLEPDYPVELSAALKYYRYFMPGRLGRGNYGMEVELLQGMLQELGYPAGAGGYFDEVTARALAAFQEDAGLEPSGIFDDITWIHLRSALDKAARKNDTQLQKAVELLKQPALWGQRGR